MKRKFFLVQKRKKTSRFFRTKSWVDLVLNMEKNEWTKNNQDKGWRKVIDLWILLIILCLCLRQKWRRIFFCIMLPFYRGPFVLVADLFCLFQPKSTNRSFFWRCLWKYMPKNVGVCFSSILRSACIFCWQIMENNFYKSTLQIFFSTQQTILSNL